MKKQKQNQQQTIEMIYGIVPYYYECNIGLTKYELIS